MNRAMRSVGFAAAFGALVLGASNLRARASSTFVRTQTYEDIYYLPPSGWLRPFSLGYHDALADLIWMRALVYFGDEIVNHGAVQHAFDYTEAMIELSPHMRAAYSWIATSGLYHSGGTITAADARRVADFLERGVRMFPNDGDLEWQLGATYSYELPPLLASAEERDASKRQGLPHLERAARLGAGPPWLALSNATQLMRLGQQEQALRHLEEIYATVHDEDSRREMAARIAQLRSDVYAEAFERVNREQEEARRRDYPYLTPTMFLFVGEKLHPEEP